MVFNKNNKKEISAIEDLIDAKIYVNPTRFEELSKLKGDIWSRMPEETGELCTLLCFNLSPEVEHRLRSLKGYILQVEHISEDKADPRHKEDRKRFLKLFSGKRLEEGRVVAIAHQITTQDEELSLLDRRVIALSLLNKLPVVALATIPDPLPAASAATGNTWPVFFVPHPEQDMRPVCQWLAEELPRVRALSGRIQEDLQARVAHLGRVSAPLHFLSRASVALVPFGVMTVNFLGILRLMANMLQCVGMRGDTSANRALGLLGAKNAALVTAIDSMGDVYSFAVFATVLADLQGLGLVEAAAAMDVLDGLMLGSISAVTGAVSAVGAYLSRPVVVRAAAEFLASLQTIYVLNPAMRRERERRQRHRGRRDGGCRAGKKESAGCKERKLKEERSRRRKGGAEGGEAEELQCLLQRSARGRAGLRRPGAAEAVAAAVVGEGGLGGQQREQGDGVAQLPGGSSGDEVSFPHVENPEGGMSSSTSGVDTCGEVEEVEGEEEGEEGEEEEEGGSGAQVEYAAGAEQEPHGRSASAPEGGRGRRDGVVGGDAGKSAGQAIDSPDAAAAASNMPATLSPMAAAAANEEPTAGGGAACAPKLSRADKKLLAAANRIAAREAQAATAAAKATAKAERKAAEREERERKRQQKHLQREQRTVEKAAEKAATKAAKERRRLPPAARVGEGGVDNGVSWCYLVGNPAAANGDGDGDGGSAAGSAAVEADAAKAPWWRRRKSATAASAGVAAEVRRSDGGDEQAAEDGLGRSSGSGSGSLSGESAAGGDDSDVEAEATLQRRVEASMSHSEAHLGLDEATCRGLMDFLGLPDEEVYGGEAAAAAQSE